MSENNGQVSGASRNKEKNAGADGTQVGSGNTTASDSDEQPSFFGKWPVCAQLVLILSIIACIVILLIGLPVASMLIVGRMSPGSLEGTMSFWGALFAAFISLTTIFIGATFAFTAFKVQTGAILEARKAAEKEVGKNVDKIISKQAKTYLKKHGKKLTRSEADGYLKQHGNSIIRQSADDYIRDEWQTVTRQSADDYIRDEWAKITRETANGYLVNNGRKLFIEVAGGYLKDNGPEPTKKAADAYIEEHGERIARGTLEKYAKKRMGLTGWLRGVIKPKGTGEGSSKDTHADEKQTAGEASTHTPDHGPDNTDSRP
ncbi:MAG: hypothetical protein OXN26_11700 [Gammaproteobacteria bacterium]|nr:hypothetical protein [Gammaproteobacteria bacterium]